MNKTDAWQRRIPQDDSYAAGQVAANLDGIEAIIDTQGLYGLLETIESVCHEKAAHLAENWQDEDASKEWTRAASVISTTLTRQAISRVS